MFLNILTLFIALSISAVAIYYSVAGLATIFAASVIPIVIMGTTLEVAKLVTAVWLHRHWKNAVWWLKTYLATAVVVLMFITSMGIFGFLSKSHIEQAAASDEQTAKIESITNRIERAEIKTKRWQDEIAKLSSGEANTRVDTLIEREQAELNRITNVVNAEKQTVRDAAAADLARFEQQVKDARTASEREIDRINQNLNAAREAHAAEMPALNKAASSCFSCREEEAAVAAAKEAFAKTEAQANQDIADAKENLKTNIASIQDKEKSARNDLKDRLAAVDDKYKLQFAQVNDRLASLKQQSEDKTGSIDERIAQLEKDLEAEQATIDTAREEKSVLESKFRQLEAEVGPVKYIAQFVYGPEAGRDLLEEAVRWVIITIIFVFDPLAVLLLIASQYSFEMARDKKKKNDSGPDPETNIPDTTYSVNLQTAPVPTPSPPPQPKTIEIPQVADFPEREQPAERESIDLEPAPVKKVAKKKKKVSKKKKPVSKKKETKDGSSSNRRDRKIVRKSNTRTQTKEQDQSDGNAGLVEETKTVKKKVVKKKTVKKKVAPKATVEDEPVVEDPDALRNDNPKSQLVRSGEYINFKGKLYKDEALIVSHPELELDYYLKHRVPYGPRFPEKMQEGRLFLRTDLLPTKLYRSNGKEWELQDKNILHQQSYSEDYIQLLVDKVAEGEYNPELLNNIEKQLIKQQIADEF
jgi:hypothetical protein